MRDNSTTPNADGVAFKVEVRHTPVHTYVRIFARSGGSHWALAGTLTLAIIELEHFLARMSVGHVEIVDVGGKRSALVRHTACSARLSST